MPTISVEARLTPADLLDAARQLDPDDLEAFVAEVVALRNQRAAHSLDKSESELFQIINQKIADDPQQQRFDYLRPRLRAETFTEAEREEFIQLNNQREMQNVRRIEALATLARRRGVTLPQIMDQLGITAPAYE